MSLFCSVVPAGSVKVGVPRLTVVLVPVASAVTAAGATMLVAFASRTLIVASVELLKRPSLTTR